jgi:Bifunctional DNA primase/polymerase, N-terminal
VIENLNATRTDPSPLEAARGYVEQGLSVVPIPRGKKGPILPGWPTIRIAKSELPEHFGSGPNVGILLGDASRGLVDIDCDVSEASVAARILLPPTGAIHGRASNPRSHFYFFADPIPAPTKFVAPDGTTLVEIRGNGQQTLAPPSVHPSGEIIRWERNGDPGYVDCRTLEDAVARVAAVTLLARSYPAPGRRNDLANAIAGTLLRAGWDQRKTERFIEAVATAANDEETKQRVRDVLSTADRLAAEKPVTGATRLAEIVGPRIAGKACEWLKIERPALRIDEAAPSSLQQWPEPLAEVAFYGTAGNIVRAIAPHTESDPAAVLIQLLAGIGNLIGRSPHFRVEGDQHSGNLYAVIVGDTAKGRKGTSWSRAREVLRAVDPVWEGQRIQPGLASGEGLIWAVRDEIWESDKKGEPQLVDEGVSDKRLLAYESEFASVLNIISRDGNTLSPILREAWDRGDLQFLTKNSPAKAAGAHISIIAHVTRDELLRGLSGTERANGFANRFLFICARRSNLLPEGGFFDLKAIDDLVADLRQVVEFAKFAGKMERDFEAKALWAEVYEDLSEGKPGLLGAVTSRAEAQVLRLSILYALLDCSTVIGRRHLEAALAVWKYAFDSARFIFGELLGDPVADEIQRALRGSEGGFTRTEISALFGRHKREVEIDRALRTLAERGLAVARSETTGGRPAIRWMHLAVAKKAK